MSAAQRIERYRSRSDSDDTDDEMLRDAVLYNLVIIGEAAGALDEQVRSLAPEIDWRSIKGLRNRLAHAYYGIDMSSVWNTVDVYVPELAEVAEALPRQLE